MSNIKKDINREYGQQFVENYSLFKQGEICFCSEPGMITYVYEGQVCNFDGVVIRVEQNRNDVQVFFDHLPESYQTYNIGKHVDSILSIMLDGKDWEIKETGEVYRYRDGKFYRVIRGYVFTTWLAEEEVAKNQIIVRILDRVNFDDPSSSAQDMVTEETCLETSTVVLTSKDFPPLTNQNLRKRK